jgi:uncharacterized protein (TIGR02453 family)
MARSFTPTLFSFLRDLEANNERPWFQANKDRYDRAVREPALTFIQDFAPYLAKISPHFVADPRTVGGSLFRIHRDTRFSNDKTPYKTHTGMQFRHEAAKDVHAPGFYLHLEPGANFAGVGIWRPDAATARLVRAAIVADPARWRRITQAKRFRHTYTLEGESLKRPPKGFDPDHPFITDLKRKDFIATANLTQKAVTADGFVVEYSKLCRSAAPFMEFLCNAIGVPF